MPIYEYFCHDCGLGFELLRPLCQADEAAACPRCHNPAERKLSAFASFSKNDSGESVHLGGSSGSCTGCSSTNCGTCGH